MGLGVRVIWNLFKELPLEGLKTACEELGVSTAGLVASRRDEQEQHLIQQIMQ